MSGRDWEPQGFIAGNRAQLKALWDRVGGPTAIPTLDLRRYAVIGVAKTGSECAHEVLAVDAEPNAVLRVRRAADPTSCSDVAVRTALVLAIPRQLLERTVTFVDGGQAFRFETPNPGEPLAAEPPPTGTAPPTATARHHRVQLPARGEIGLRALPNGTEIWVTHDTDGNVHVMAAAVSLAQYEHGDWDPFLSAVVTYQPELGRFVGGYDAHGRNVHGRAPLQARGWVPADENHIEVGANQELAPGPVQPREQAPKLEGPDRAYSTLRARKWDAVADGQVALLDADWVISSDGLSELCDAPTATQSVEFFYSCPAGSPRVRGPVTRGRGQISYGPFVVLRRGNSASVTLTGPILRRVLPVANLDECSSRVRRGRYHGYEVQWIHGDDPDAHGRICPHLGTHIILDHSIVRGTGSRPIGNALRSLIEPHLERFSVISWSRGCDGSSLVITLAPPREACLENAVTRAVGEALRANDASCRVIIRFALRGATR